MNLYLLTQNVNNGWDTYDSMVIAAENEEDAKHLSFVQCSAYEEYSTNDYITKKPVWRNYYESTYSFAYSSWDKNPTVELIATNTLVDEGVVCASFNAG
jgi:hypothetical protein